VVYQPLMGTLRALPILQGSIRATRRSKTCPWVYSMGLKRDGHHNAVPEVYYVGCVFMVCGLLW